MPRGNPSPRLAITINPDIHQHVLAAAARDGVSVSAWIPTQGARSTVEAGWFGGDRLVGKQHGRLTAEEMSGARRSVRAQIRTARTTRRPA